MIDMQWLEENGSRKNPFEFEELIELQKPFLRLGGWKLDPVVGLYNSEKNIRACPLPVLPTALYRNAATGQEKVELKFWKYGKWNGITVDREVISSRSRIVGLSNLGIEVTSKNAYVLMEALNEIISGSLDIIHSYSSVSRLGWHRGEFVPYSSFIVFDSPNEFRSIAGCIEQKGSLEEWTAFISPMMKDVRFRLAMAASFASPLIELIGQLPFVFHLWGKSGSGKTVTAMCAASVWGDPNPGRYMKSLNMTVNALLSAASVLNNLPFIGDELQTIRNRTEGYDRLIMTACEGINRGRMNMNRMEDTLYWRNAFIFTGEEPVTGSASGAGAVNRVIQVECSSDLIPDGNAAANFVRSHYGTAGKEFIESLDREQVKQCCEGYVYALRTQCAKDGIDATAKQMNAMAVLMTADALAGMKFFPETWREFRPEELYPYLADKKEADVGERAYEFICDLISANGLAFTADAKERWGVPGTGNTVYFNNSILNRELKKAGYESRSVKKSWADSGHILFNPTEHKYRFKKSVCGTMTSCICIALDDSDPKKVWEQQ